MAECGADAKAPSIWYRNRYLVYSLLAMNSFMLAYALLPRKKPEPEQAELKQVTITPQSAKPEISQALQKHASVSISKNDQVELYKWMLSERRKMKPSSSEEKARIDMEKAMLKDFIRGKGSLEG